MNREIIHQFHGKTTYNGERIYIDKAYLAKAGFIPGARFRTKTNVSSHTIEFEIDSHGANMVSKKMKKEYSVPVIDKVGNDIRAVLKECAQIKVTFVQDRVIVEGIKQSADVLKEIHEGKEHTTLTTISFCAGTGISSQCMVDAGFSEVAAVEWNPKEGSEDKFSEIYTRNHSDTVMFNMPMQMLQPNDLPYADVWVATLDCSDFSKASNGTKKEFYSMHLYMHLMRLFWGREKQDRPMAILIENVPEFEKIAGISLELCLQEEGFFITRTKLDSLDYGSRTKRERFFMVASIYDGFTFPEATGRNTRSIMADGILHVDDMEWITAEDSDTLKYFLSREHKGGMTHNHHMTLFDIATDAYVGTITKSHHKIQPENWIKHPTNPNLYAYLKGEHIRALHGIASDYYLGDSNKMVVESIGQSVCLQTFGAIARKLYAFLSGRVGAAAKSLHNVIALQKPEPKADIYDVQLFSLERSGQLAML